MKTPIYVKPLISGVATSSFIIYGLCDPYSSEIRYIGQSSLGTYRPQDHIRLALRGENTHKAKWIRSLYRRGITYTVVILECLENASRLNETECAWIAGARACGWRLTNATDGGEGTRGLHLPKSAQARANISAGLKGLKKSDEMKLRLSKALRGRKLSAEHKAHLSSAVRPPRTEVHRENLSKALLGHKISDATKEKISIKASERAATESGRERLLKQLEKARAVERVRSPASDETRKKMSESAQRRAATADGYARLCAASRSRFSGVQDV